MVNRRNSYTIEFRAKVAPVALNEDLEENIFDALEWPRQKAMGCKHWLAMCSHLPAFPETPAQLDGNLGPA
jgi:hypothetical protein